MGIQAKTPVLRLRCTGPVLQITTLMHLENTYASLPDVFHESVRPAMTPAPSLIRLNQGLCEELAIDATWLKSDAGLAMLSGNHLPESSNAISMAYAGHQFGGWNPQLGDGRAILLGEVVDPGGVRHDIQLKGSGKTPYSRGGDGKATIGSVLREYIVGEAMAALGVPTTRALAVVTTGESIQRETPLPGAILTRVAQSHVRVGTFQFFHSRGNTDALRTLADYVIARHFTESRASKTPYLHLYQSICQRQADLIAKWMQLGFIHGVMNTDNMQVVGETIDYGPCAFMDEFHPKCVFSSIDRQGRYAWDNQPVMGQWNLARLGEALLPILIEEAGGEDTAVASAEDAIEAFNVRFNEQFLSGFRTKLGISGELDDDREFTRETFRTMAAQKLDFTLFFRNLTEIAAGKSDELVIDLFADADAGRNYLVAWRKQVAKGQSTVVESATSMQKVNPIYIPRNHRIEEAIQHAQTGDFSLFHALVSVLSSPYKEQAEHIAYENPPKESEKVHETFCGT